MSKTWRMWLDGVRNTILVLWVNSRVNAETLPKLPHTIIGIGLCSYNAMVALELCSATITEEIVSGLGVSKSKPVRLFSSRLRVSLEP